MRKLMILVAAFAAVFATTAVAVAQSGGVSVTASSSPSTKKASKKKPVPVSVRFGVNSTAAGRPATIRQFKVAFTGFRTNGKAFKTCTAAKMNAAQSDARCPAAAKVGSGTVNNLAGAQADPSDMSLPCNLKLTIYNAGNKRAALWLKGGPGVAGADCVIPIAQALDAKWVPGAGGEALQFTIPDNLQHPVAGLSNGIKTINATIAKKTAKSKGKKVGFFEAIACKGGKHNVKLSLTPESGAAITASTSAKC